MMDAFQKQYLDPTGQPQARSILIVEDDERLMQRLARAMEARGFQVMTAGLVFEGLAQLQLNAPKYAVVDLRFDDGCGLDVVEALMQQRPDARGIILTGYGNIATAVKALNSAPSTILRNLWMRMTLSPRCRRHWAAKLRRHSAPCRQPMCACSISSKFMRLAGETFRRPRAASICIGEHCNGFLADGLGERPQPEKPGLDRPIAALPRPLIAWGA
jgi:CheY-like chemotaxis protein